MTTTATPLSNVNCATLVAAVARAAGAASVAAKQRARAVRIRVLGTAMLSVPVPNTGSRSLRGIAANNQGYLDHRLDHWSPCPTGRSKMVGIFQPLRSLPAA